MALKVIGAGFGRTGTHSLKFALEILGFSKCYHMEELIVHHPENLHYWEDARNGKPVDWDALFRGYQAAVDFPAILHYKTLMKKYPDAKVILTIRDADSWYKSFGDTIIRQSQPGLMDILKMSVRLPFSKVTRQRLKVVQFAGKNLKDWFGDRYKKDPEMAKRFYTEWNEEVKRHVPPEKLLIYRSGQGWGPLCEFLGCPVPDVPYPHSNTTEEFNARSI